MRATSREFSLATSCSVSALRSRALVSLRDSTRYGDAQRGAGVKRREPTVESRQPSVMTAGERDEVGVRDLAVPGDAFPSYLPVVHIVGPELVPRRAIDSLEHNPGVTGTRAMTEKQAQQGALSHRAGGKALVVTAEPPLRRRMVDMVGHDQSDQNVAVEKEGHSSSIARTSAAVTGRPTRTTGRPVLRLRRTPDFPPGAGWRRQPAMISSMVELNVRRRSLAMESSISWRSSESVMVVRITQHYGIAM